MRPDSSPSNSLPRWNLGHTRDAEHPLLTAASPESSAGFTVRSPPGARGVLHARPHCLSMDEIAHEEILEVRSGGFVGMNPSCHSQAEGTTGRERTEEGPEYGCHRAGREHVLAFPGPGEPGRAGGIAHPLERGFLFPQRLSVAMIACMRQGFARLPFRHLKLGAMAGSLAELLIEEPLLHHLNSQPKCALTSSGSATGAQTSAGQRSCRWNRCPSQESRR